MGKITKYFGQTIFSQIFSLIPLKEIISIISNGGYDKYTKKFNSIDHLITLLYGVLKGFDSLREITNDLSINEKRLKKSGLSKAPSRSTISDANNRRSASFFGNVYSMLYGLYANFLSNISDSGSQKWLRLLHVIDSTTITLFSNLLFKGAGRHPKTGRKKGGIKVHSNIHANEFVPSDIRFTSAATNDSFMLKPSSYAKGDVLAFDRAYIDYAKFEELTRNGVVYVTKMKKNLVYETASDTICWNPDGLMRRIQRVVFRKHVKDGDDIVHHARIVTYVDARKDKTRLVSLLTNDMDMGVEDIIAIYRKRWEIELLFKQLKQNFPLRYFYGESANAIKIQIWVTLIANLLLLVIQRRVKRPWSFSGLATMVRIMLMYYVNCYTFLENPERDWTTLLEKAKESPPELTLF
jgi:hypothetical protein